MEFLIYESNSKLLGGHVLKIKKVFQDVNFCYVQNFPEMNDKIKFNGQYYDFIFCRENQEDKISGENIYKAIRAQGALSSIIFISERECRIKENVEDRFFCLNQSYGTEDLDKIFNAVASKATVEETDDPVLICS